MSNSKLVCYQKLSPNYTKMSNKKNKKISIHHMAGNISIETCGDIFMSKSRQASSNYGIGSDGRIGLYVDEANRSWCTSSYENDSQAVTIEVANDGGKPTWHVSDKAIQSLIELCVDICKRNGIKKLNFTGDKSGNVTLHKWFYNTNCPGPYLESKMPYIVKEVNNRLCEEEKEFVPYRVRVTASALNIRAGAGTQYKINGVITDKGVYTIVEEKNGFLRLKSGAGWISAAYVKKI